MEKLGWQPPEENVCFTETFSKIEKPGTSI